jgi:hypothetical protein
MPESCPYDHAIELKEDFVPRNCKIYALLQVEEKEMNEFIDENLCKGYIRPLKSPMASVTVAPYFLLFSVFFSPALIATAPHTWLSHGRHAEAMRLSCSAHSASFASRIIGYLVTRPFLGARSRTITFPIKVM